MKRFLVRVLKWGSISLAVLVVLALIFLMPRRVSTTGFESQRYYKHDIESIDHDAKRNQFTLAPGPLRAGWGVAKLTPEKLTPLAGFGDRYPKKAEGVHDDVYVKAIAFNDGTDTAVLVGSDLLLVNHLLAERIREQVAKQTPLKPGQLFFTASHTHSGPGGFAPGWMEERAAFGPFEPTLPDYLAKRFADAIATAYNTMEPAKVAHASADAGEDIRNRTREAQVDPELSILVVEKENGQRCYVTSFSAHPTVMGGKNMLMSAEYPGSLQRYVEAQTGGTCVYLGGAVGSMTNKVPEAAVKELQAQSATPEDPFLRVQALGEDLGKRLLENVHSLQFKSEAEVASIGVPLELPPPAWRVLGPLTRGLFGPNWSMNPFLMKMLGISGAGWMSAVRVGDVMFVNAPGDFSGEISADWKKWGAERGLDLWVSGFSGEYAGYISPDKYFGEVYDAKKKGELAYETGFMSMTGPHQEAFFTALMQHMVQNLTPTPAK